METIDKLIPESGWFGKLADDVTPESWKASNYNDDYEGDNMRAAEAQAAETKQTNALETSRKKRNAIFQSSKGSGAMLEGSGVLNVGARDTYYGN